MKKLLQHTLVLLTGLLALALAGCDGGGGSDSASTGPAGSSSFAGSSISFNPTVSFSTGGVLTYLNTTSGSAFPAAAVAVNGTYTYTPGANFTTGTLTLTIDGVGTPIVLELSAFVRNGTNITGFTARANGQNYATTVTGALAAYQAPSGGSGGGVTTGLVEATTDIAASTQGTYELTFANAFGGSQVSGSPHNAGDKVNFVIGARTLKVGAKTLTNPKNPSTSTTDFVYQDGNLWYWVYGDRTPVQINLYGGANPTQAGTTFYGSFKNEADDEEEEPSTPTGSTPGNYTSTFTLLPSGTGTVTGAPANGASVAFTVSNDQLTLTFNGRTLPRSSTSVSAVVYTDSATSPTNNLTVTLRLDTATGAITSYEGMYSQFVVPTMNVAYFTSGTITKL